MFESITESKIQQWQQEKSKPGYKPPPPIANTFGKPLEQQLIEEIEAFVIQASKQNDKIKKEELLKKAKYLEIQLLVSFENQGLNLVADNIQNRLQQFRKDNL